MILQYNCTRYFIQIHCRLLCVVGILMFLKCYNTVPIFMDDYCNTVKPRFFYALIFVRYSCRWPFLTKFCPSFQTSDWFSYSWKWLAAEKIASEVEEGRMYLLERYKDICAKWSEFQFCGEISAEQGCFCNMFSDKALSHFKQIKQML